MHAYYTDNNISCSKGDIQYNIIDMCNTERVKNIGFNAVYSNASSPGS